ncbi:MAG: hypothetical protein KIS76_16180 [Pyrinomonadaceae bacterium]|nr:hypothetical protein [Pyrinomonadaceae bacterium]
MIADLKTRQLLTGKSKEEIENLLGEPDYRDANWIAYKVNAISRRYIWECRMEITFDPQTETALNPVAVSD